MGKISAPSNFSSVQSWEDLRRFAAALCGDIVTQISGNLTFADNIKGIAKDVYFPNANISVAVTHNLGYLPNGFLVTSIDSGSVIYDSPEKNTTGTIFLSSSLANVNATVRVF